jgi:hypothetical protein
MTETSQSLIDILFNPNVRPMTRERVLLATLNQLDIQEATFLKTLLTESQRDTNVEADQRERERDVSSADIVAREKAFMRGENLA